MAINYRSKNNRKKIDLTSNFDNKSLQNETSVYKTTLKSIKNLLFNPSKSTFIMLILLPIELFINIGIILNVKCKF
jgi:hypothetical protein